MNVQQDDSFEKREAVKEEGVVTSCEETASMETASLEEEESKTRRCWTRFLAIYNEYEFLILIVLAILLAKAYPPLGDEYLAPHITATWIAVIFIFVLAGLGLRTEEFKSAFKQVYFNAFVQLFNFGFVSALVFGITRILVEIGALVPSLADGMVICASLPMAINMVLILTKTADGDEAAAIFNAAFANLVGVFLSPMLILGYLGVNSDVDIVNVFYKLFLRVVLPLIAGQVIQKSSTTVVQFMKAHKYGIKKAQIYALVFIVYTVFCTTFADGATDDVGVGNIFLVIFFQFALLCIVTTIAWFTMRFLFRDEPRLRVMGTFGCTYKTVSVGVPLINAMYENNPNVGLYTLPLLIWHPMQLVIGSFLAPRLKQFVQREKERLSIVDDDDEVKSKSRGDMEATNEMSMIDEAQPEQEGCSGVIDVEQPVEQ
eukprot:CAMPEP_0119009148 /NCGR_PEP_ID=MMETSP1176-20130426/4172_1 /TAXON_ID=265551 /ORGANISM="Synedropsis recta cf, Strain CCMP1620" /LENGTH=429 /DNA_ID=CAMNT_0006961605 /DNA_START=11 /DNA_END=1300 /DNA_ORIENTATION=+